MQSLLSNADARMRSFNEQWEKKIFEQEVLKSKNISDNLSPSFFLHDEFFTFSMHSRNGLSAILFGKIGSAKKINQLMSWLLTSKYQRESTCDNLHLYLVCIYKKQLKGTYCSILCPLPRSNLWAASFIRKYYRYHLPTLEISLFK